MGATNHHAHPTLAAPCRSAEEQSPQPAMRWARVGAASSNVVHRGPQQAAWSRDLQESIDARRGEFSHTIGDDGRQLHDTPIQLRVVLNFVLNAVAVRL
jgi:hypothetical protein